jgi:hypothetical protein
VAKAGFAEAITLQRKRIGGEIRVSILGFFLSSAFYLVIKLTT